MYHYALYLMLSFFKMSFCQDTHVEYGLISNIGSKTQEHRRQTQRGHLMLIVHTQLFRKSKSRDFKYTENQAQRIYS